MSTSLIDFLVWTPDQEPGQRALVDFGLNGSSPGKIAMIACTHRKSFSKVSSLSVAVCVFTQAGLLVAPAHAEPFSSSKKTTLQTPVEERLGANADLTRDTTNSAPPSAPPNIAPLSLTDASSKEPDETVPLKTPKNIQMEQAKRVNIMPLSLIASDAEVDEKIAAELGRERSQILDLWEATLNRSPDIQFVIQKLMPTSDPGRTATMLMRLLSSAIVGAGTAASVVVPNPFMVMGTQTSSSLIQSFAGIADAKHAKHAQIDQGQAITLYKIVRDVGDSLTETYRDYKQHLKRLERAQIRTDKLIKMVEAARPGQDAVKQIEMDYLIDKAQGDIEEAISDARRYRQSLVDLAGIKAVDKLDQQMNEQMLADQQSERERKVADKPGSQL